MLASLFVLADGITIQLGNNRYAIGLDLIMYLVIAAIVGIIAERVVKSSLPFGFVGAIIAALIGIWLMTHIIIINGIGDIYIFGVPIVRALVGAILFVLIWRAIIYRRTYRRV